MDRQEFQEAKLFIFSDVEREIQLAKVNKQELERLGVTPGGGNFLAALGLVCYTEFGGKLLSSTSEATKNFNDFFDRLGEAYKDFRKQQPDVYNVFRCGLAHEYYVKKNCTIYMLADRPGPGIGTEPNGRYLFVVESYCRDLKQAFDELEVELYGQA